MNVQTIRMPAQKARQLYLEYRTAVRAARATNRYRNDSVIRKEDEELAATYKVLAQGRRVLNIFDVMRVAGRNDSRQPRLAIARADATRSWFSKCYKRYWDGRWVFGTSSDNTVYNRRMNVVLPLVTFPRDTQSGRAIVPLIPPRLRPARALDQYFILWEADWNLPPRDPILLRRIGMGYFFAVVGQWNLTSLERSVLGLTRTDL